MPLNPDVEKITPEKESPSPGYLGSQRIRVQGQPWGVEGKSSCLSTQGAHMRPYRL